MNPTLKAKIETIEEFLKRGGNINKVNFVLPKESAKTKEENRAAMKPTFGFIKKRKTQNEM